MLIYFNDDAAATPLVEAENIRPVGRSVVGSSAPPYSSDCLSPSSWSGGGGDMNRHVPQGDADGNGKRLGAVVLLLAKQRLGGWSPAITGNKKLHRNDDYDSNAENKVHK
jgi:hypothetical protein